MPRRATPASWDRRRQPSRDTGSAAAAARAPRAGRQYAGSGIYRRKGSAGAQGAGLDVVQLQRDGRLGGHGCFVSLASTDSRINRLRRPERPMSGRRQVGEDVRGRGRRPVHAVTDARSVAGVDEQRVERVHHVVVQRPAAARFVGAPVERRLLDLEVAVRGVRLRDVDHQVVGEQQLGQRVGAVRAERPVDLAVQAVIEREVGVQPGAVGAAIVLAHVEGVFQVVEVADLQVAVDLVELLHLP